MNWSFVMGAWLAAANILCFSLMGVDKSRARRGMWRIKERTLLLTAIAGGSLGGLLGMAAFHHKVNKTAFSLGLPLILACQLALAYYVIK